MTKMGRVGLYTALSLFGIVLLSLCCFFAYMAAYIIKHKQPFRHLSVKIICWALASPFVLMSCAVGGMDDGRDNSCGMFITSLLSLLLLALIGTPCLIILLSDRYEWVASSAITKSVLLVASSAIINSVLLFLGGIACLVVAGVLIQNLIKEKKCKKNLSIDQLNNSEQCDNIDSQSDKRNDVSADGRPVTNLPCDPPNCLEPANAAVSQTGGIGS